MSESGAAKAWAMMRSHVRCGFVLDVEWAKRIGNWFGVDGVPIALSVVWGGHGRK